MSVTPHIPDTVAEAKVGDHLWIWNVEKFRYRDGRYVGRGDWTLEPVSEAGRASVTISAHRKFSRQDGSMRGAGKWSPGYHAYGAIQRECREIMESRTGLADKIRSCRDVAVILKIAELLSKPNSPLFGEE